MKVTMCIAPNSLYIAVKYVRLKYGLTESGLGDVLKL